MFSEVMVYRVEGMVRVVVWSPVEKGERANIVDVWEHPDTKEGQTACIKQMYKAFPPSERREDVIQAIREARADVTVKIPQEPDEKSGRTIFVTPEEETALYNSVYLAEKYARGVRAKAEAREGMKVALKLGLPFKHDTD